jgi:replicative DNA helicase
MLADPRVARTLYGQDRTHIATTPDRPSTGRVPSEPWETPILIDDGPLPTFPVRVFPDWLRAFVQAESLATQTPLDLPGMLALSVLATVGAGRIRVRLKDGHEEPLNVFTATVLPPGSRKSQVFRDVTEPLEAFEAEEAELLRETVASQMQNRRLLEARLKVAESRVAKARPDRRAQLLEEAQAARRELASHPLPTIPRLIADDCSPERLSTLMRDHDGRMAVLSPEGDVFDLMAGRYSANGAPNLGVYLKGHAGDALRVDRIGRGPEFVRSPALTLGLAIQPEVLSGLMGRPGFRGRGLLGRILFSLPRNTLGSRDVDAPSVPEAVRDAYSVRIRRILRFPRGTDAEGAPAPHILRLTAEALETYRRFERELEPRLGDFGDLSHLTDWAGKVAGAVGRIAGLLHVADHVESYAPWETPISQDCAERAIRVGEYLIPHALAAFGKMGADPELEGAKYLLGWIQRTGTRDFTKREAFQGTKGRFKRVRDLEPALAILEEHHYIRSRPRPERGGPGRPPSPTLEVNPALRSHNPHNPQNPTCEDNCEDCEDCGSGAPGVVSSDFALEART